MNVLTSKYKEKLFFKIDKFFSKYENNCKKIALKLAWWNIKFIFTPLKKQACFFNDEKQHVGIHVAGGIGDLICAGKYIKSLALYLDPNVVIDVIAETRDVEVLKCIFYGQDFVHEVVDEHNAYQYDLRIRLIRFPVIDTYIQERLSEHSLNYVKMINDFHKTNPLLSRNDFLGRCFSLMKGHSRANQADVDDCLNMANSDFSINIPKSNVLEKFKLQKNQFITVQSGPGIHFQDVSNEVRQWPIAYYQQLVHDLKVKYPHYKIIQLGELCQKKIENVDYDLRGKTNFNELCYLLKSAKLHISQEGGMPIIRHFVGGGSSVVLFGPTDEKFFGFDENINVTARQCAHSCEWLTMDWMRKCMKTNECAECMQLLKPEKVLEIIVDRGVL